MARAREMAQMAAAGGADAPFGVSCTRAAWALRPRQKEVGGSFRVYQFLIEEKVADLLFFSPPRENGGGCTPSA